MENAKIWITTPPAMMQASVPIQLNNERLKFGDLIYQQSDVVFFDEVEIAMDWCDKTFSEVVTLTDGGTGLLDDLDPQVTSYLTRNRVPPPSTARWVGAERGAAEATTPIITLLGANTGRKEIQQWVGRRAFTANTLLFRLSRRLAGLREIDPPDLSIEQRSENDERTRKILRYFDKLLSTDPIRRNVRVHKRMTRIDRLALIMQAISNTLESADDANIFEQCKTWIKDFYPNIETHLDALREEMRKGKYTWDSEEDVDSLETLAYRLQFALSIATLDRHLKIVLYEWNSKPTEINKEQPYRRMPRHLQDILPLPLEGRQFGFIYEDSSNDDGKSNRAAHKLSLFAYTNIGRCYLLDYHQLYKDIDGKSGPHVLALSGTSYLPDSTRFHVDLPPIGVLMPDENAVAALSGGLMPRLGYEIGGSVFSLRIQTNHKGKPIFFSGNPRKTQSILEMAAALVRGDDGGELGAELRDLIQLGITEPDLWADRARILILVNSYEQSEAVASFLSQVWPEQSRRIFRLNKGESDDETKLIGQSIARSDVEQFCQTGGTILVAPLQSVGRGLNILNSAGKAAFGAVYFMTRPMPQPFDLQLMIQELNARTLNWAKNPNFTAWEADEVHERGTLARSYSKRYWRWMEKRRHYRGLIRSKRFDADPRRDLAATTGGLIIQATGRLLRGEVPFHAYFVDAAWTPNTANPENDNVDTVATSLLAAVIDTLTDYVDNDPIADVLYRPFSDVLVQMNGLDTSQIARGVQDSYDESEESD
jgi:hypothetical protein